MPYELEIDTTSVFAFQQFLKQQDYPIQGNINYGALLDALHGAVNESPSAVQSRSLPSNSVPRSRLSSRTTAVTRNGPEPVRFNHMFAFVAINPEHEGQQKFCAFLRSQGLTVDVTDYRDAFVLPNREHPYQRLSTRLTYMAGMLSAPYDRDGNRRQLPHIVAVTDAFDVYFPLLDYVQNRGGQASIAFFRRGMEDRWQRAGLFDDDSPITFLDLSDDAKAILGADLSSSFNPREGGKGLADFQL